MTAVERAAGNMLRRHHWDGASGRKCICGQDHIPSMSEHQAEALAAAGLLRDEDTP